MPTLHIPCLEAALSVSSENAATTACARHPALLRHAAPSCPPYFWSGKHTQLTGATLDPGAELAFCLQGYHNGGPLIGTIGLFKGVLGLIARPTAGLLEWVGKGTHGVGLICLGREAITGSAQRRMRAPGALSDEPAEVGVAMDLPGSGAAGLDSAFSAQRHVRAPRALSDEPAEVGGVMQCVQVEGPNLVLSAQRRMRVNDEPDEVWRVQGSGAGVRADRRGGSHESAWKRGWKPGVEARIQGVPRSAQGGSGS